MPHGAVAAKTAYEIGTILVVRTFDGKNTRQFFFELFKRRPNGNYIGKQIFPTEVPLPEFRTCEGYKTRLDLPALMQGGEQRALTWQRADQVYSHCNKMLGCGFTTNEIYDPLKTYYNEG